MRYAKQDGTVLPITVWTYDDLERAGKTVSARNLVFCALYPAQAAAVGLFYFKKRMRCQ